jgi:hypothetical protein
VRLGAVMAVARSLKPPSLKTLNIIFYIGLVNPYRISARKTVGKTLFGRPATNGRIRL